MSYNTLITDSIKGRRLGLQRLSTGQTGGSEVEFLVGAEAVRMGVTTAETTGKAIKAFGVSNLVGTSAGSSAVYVLDPPIPGVRKIINIGTTDNGPIYLKTKNGETFNTTLGTTFTVIKSSAGGYYELTGVTTAIWGAVNITSGTSSNASGHVMSATT